MTTVSPSPDLVKAWLAALIRSAEPDPMPEEAALLSTARAEGVLALCHERLRQSPTWEQYPVTLRAALTQHVRQEVAVEMLRAVELREVLAALARQGLSVLLLKGAALAYTLYSEPHLRNRCDTDLLLASREDAERAWGVLQTLGYQRPNTVAGDLVCVEFGCYKIGHGGLSHALDIHWRWSNVALFAGCLTFAELVAVAVPVSALGSQAYGLNPVHALLQACMHRVAHRLWDSQPDRLIWLYDIHLLAQQLTSDQWEQVATLATERVLCGPCLDGLSTAQAWFATCPPDEIVSRLRAGTGRERLDLGRARQPWRLEWLTFQALPSAASRWRWLAQRLFPDVNYLRERYGVHHPGWLPWFYGLRIFQGVAKRLR